MRKLLGLSVIVIFAMSSVSLALAADIDVIPKVELLKGKPPGKGGGGGSTTQILDWGYVRIGAADARSRTNGVVQVAVLDTGVDFDHPDLAGVVTWCYSAIKRTEGCNRNSDDSDGHGTHVAGTIAALDNSQDIVGAAAGHVEIYNVKVLGRNGGDWNDLAHGIRVAAEGPDGVLGTADDAEVISMSLGGDISAFPDIQQMLQDAIDYARSGGSAVVAAAGNEGTCEAGDVQHSWPAENNGVITVGATGIYANGAFVREYTGTEEDVMPCFSNEMPPGVVDVSAPGVYITSLKRGGGTTEMSGTSMATPYTSAIVALLMANGYSADQALNRLKATAIDMGYPSTLQGAGLINAAAAV